MLGRRRGQVAAMQDLRNLVAISRFLGLFAATILLPMLLLVVLAVSSIGAEEAGLSRELRKRSDSLAEALAQIVVDEGDSLRIAVLARLARRESLFVDHLALSPELRAVFRFDPDGELLAPFDRRTDTLASAPPSAWVTLRRLAQIESSFGRHSDAALLWERAGFSVERDMWAAEAELGAAREAWRAGDIIGARERLERIANERVGVRDSRGMRVSDVAALLRAETIFARDPAMGQPAMEDFVLSSLESQWTLNHGGDAALVRRALRRLEPVANGEWLSQVRKRLDERSDQQYWAALVENELDALDFPSQPSTMIWLGARAGSPALWATLRDEGGLWAFSLSSEAVLERATRAARQLAAADPDLAPVLVLPGEPLPPDWIAVGTLGQLLPTVRVAILPDDTAGFERALSRRRQTRIAVILLAVFVFVAGLVLSARIVSREVESARVKADFAANVSHELRSPITQIRLKGEALKFGLVDPGPDTEMHYDAILAEAERLSRLVDNVLDFAAIERGAKKYTLRKDYLAPLIAHAVEVARRDFETRGLTIALDTPTSVPPLMLDRDAIGQVLVNLLSNAAKYGGDAQWVGVSVAVADSHVLVSVSDRGIGIAPEDVPKLFDHFFRSTDPQVRRRKGTGIGLTIVRYIVEAHGGTISVDSAPGRGTTFTVTLPRPEAVIEGGHRAANPIR